ncbi:uncharacterized protein LOC134217878 [Armigeres subalbatus]|uniref:uncharacterized protein LOC134217878 n=1 Tax=Armigeres subalbatus TaxID=124917 RepID=UPI002ED462FF
MCKGRVYNKLMLHSFVKLRNAIHKCISVSWLSDVQCCVFPLHRHRFTIMSINFLPVELLQKIFCFLSYTDLQRISLVCHRWNNASEKFIVDKVKLNITSSFPRTYAALAEWDDRHSALNVIRSSLRNYRSIAFECNTALDEWQQLEPFVEGCAERFPAIDALYLEDIQSQYLHRLYSTHRGWISRCRFLKVSMRSDYDYSKKNDEKSEWVLAMPNLEKLFWEECEYDPLRTVTIDAPKLETIYLESYESSHRGEFRLQCSQIKHIECILYEDNLLEMFETTLDNVESLQMTLDYRIDLEFIKALRQLSYLNITFNCKMKSLDELESVCAYLQIKTLIISCSIERCFIDLENFFNCFPGLESLTFRRIDFYAENCVQARHLKYLDLQNVEYFDDTVSFNAPNLEDLILDADILDKIEFINTARLSAVQLLLMSRSIGDTLEQFIIPFLQTHEEVTHLSLKGHYYQNDSLDQPNNGAVELNIKHLVLESINVTIGFFKMISGWKSLQTLILNRCTIDCTSLADGEIILLPSVHNIETIGINRLKNTERVDFPLVTGRNSLC